MRFIDEEDWRERVAQKRRMRWLAEFVIAGLCVFALIWLFTQLL